jgi:hypothetical protein
MKQLLESKGWVMYYSCDFCGGKQYFKNNDKAGYEVRTRIKNNTFTIMLNNRIIAGPFWGYELEEKLLKYAI